MRLAALRPAQVAEVQKDVTQKQADAERDLEQAIPAVERAIDALNTIEVKDLQMAKTMSKPPPGVDDVFSAVMSLFAGVKRLPCAEKIKVQKSGKVKAEDKDWNR
mgnify:FL=1|tara:strand:+ start:37 stop:351 length:315 start_codon:yes stop_codon:yes gene_type:complete